VSDPQPPRPEQFYEYHRTASRRRPLSAVGRFLVGFADRQTRSPIGWQVEPSGLVEIGFSWQRRHPWVEVGEPEVFDDALEVDCGGVVRRFEGRPEDVVALAEAIRGHRVRFGEEPTIVAPEQLGDWLGLEPGEALVLESPLVKRLLSAVGWLLLVLGPSLISFGEIAWRNPANYVFGAAALLYFGVYRGRRDRLVVSIDGLRQGRRRYSWADIALLGGHSRWRVLWTPDGMVTLHGPHADRVWEAARQIVAARDTGAVLPRMADVPDHALSRAEADDGSAERGISLSERDGR